MAPLALRRLSDSIGGNADNIRPAQRTLQMMSKPAFIEFLSRDLRVSAYRGREGEMERWREEEKERRRGESSMC